MEFSRAGSGGEQAAVELNDVDAETLATVLSHVYSDGQELGDADAAFSALQAADVFLLPSLKRQCGAYLAENALDEDSAVGLLQTARLYNIPRLEKAAVEFMARNIRQVRSGVEYQRGYSRGGKRL